MPAVQTLPPQRPSCATHPRLCPLCAFGPGPASSSPGCPPLTLQPSAETPAPQRARCPTRIQPRSSCMQRPARAPGHLAHGTQPPRAAALSCTSLRAVRPGRGSALGGLGHLRGSLRGRKPEAGQGRHLGTGPCEETPGPASGSAGFVPGSPGCVLREEEGGESPGVPQPPLPDPQECHSRTQAVLCSCGFLLHTGLSLSYPKWLQDPRWSSARQGVPVPQGGPCPVGESSGKRSAEQPLSQGPAGSSHSPQGRAHPLASP